MARRSLSFFTALFVAILALVSLASACAGPHDVNGGMTVHSVERRQAGVPANIASMSCPVCGMEVDGTTYVELKNGQKIYTCSAQHAADVYNNPSPYENAAAAASTSDMTPVGGGMKCMFCTMDAVKGYALEFKGNQTLHSCIMTNHYQMMLDGTTLRSAFTGTKVGTDAMADSSATVPSSASSPAASSSAEAEHSGASAVSAPLAALVLSALSVLAVV